MRKQGCTGSSELLLIGTKTYSSVANRHDDCDRQDCGSLTEAVTNRIGSESLRLKSSQKLTQKMRMLAQACTQADWATSASAHVTVL